MLVSQLCMRKSSISGIPWVPRGAPRHSFRFPQSPWEDPRKPQGSETSGQQMLWPKVVMNDNGERILGCYVCMKYRRGVRFHHRSTISKGNFKIGANRKSFAKDSLTGHVMNQNGEHAKCVKNYNKAHDGAEDGALNREARRAKMFPDTEMLNKFLWLNMVLLIAGGTFENFSFVINLAQHTCSKILDDRSEDECFFKDGLMSISRILAENVANILKNAKGVAWHMDIGEGIPTYYDLLLHRIPNWL